MQTSAGRPFRFTARLQGYPYRGASFFITICSHEQRCTFGTVDEYSVDLSPLGQVIEREWLRTAVVRPDVILDQYRIMPNHFHAIVFVPPLPEDLTSPVVLSNKPVRSPFHREKRSLSSLVGGFKGAVTRAAEMELQMQRPIWQARFDDRIIRSDRALEARRRYIAENPARWTADRYYAEAKPPRE